MDNQCGDGIGKGKEQRLFDILRKELEKKEFLGKIKAEMCGKILDIVRFGDKSPINEPSSTSLNSPSCMLNHLILEYFEWMNLYFTKEMFSSEMGIKKEANRNLIEEHLNIPNGFDKDLPILFDLLMRIMKHEK